MKKCSADLVWHIIRTYIKGMAFSSHEYLTPTAYLDLPRKQKSVADTDYEFVFKNFWPWYQDYCQKNTGWDDQDLALAVLGHGTVPTCYPAIFCDEAQDFTALELKILYHLSLFSERTVPPYAISNIPFVFAGDPLQTLNPTGFRWEAVKSSFHDFLLKPFEGRVRTKCDLNYQELAANYRSSKPVVDFCNYIQLLRLCLFGDTYSVRPQEAWFTDEYASIPFLISVNSPEARELLSYSALVIIPDCHEDEEGDYVNKDKLLNDMVELDETGTPSNVLSPTMAKGLEYDEIVVLYRFGATCPTTLIERICNKKHLDAEQSVRIEWEYFFNRLYVAASRARRRLVILDEPETFETLWKAFRERDAEDLAQHMQATVNTQEWNSSCLQMIHEGSSKDIDRLRQDRKGTTDNRSELLDLAQKWRREGIDAENPQLLRRARLQFQRIKESTRATECYAIALRLEGKFANAAKEFLKIDDQASALDCFWAIPDYSSIKNNSWQGDIANDLRIDFATSLGYEKGRWLWTGSTDETSGALNRLDRQIHDVGSTDVEGWQLGITALLDRLKEDAKEQKSLAADWNQVKSIAERLNYPSYPDDNLAVIAYSLNRMREARGLWEQAGKTSSEQYHRSVYATSTWPETLRPLKAISEYEAVISEWENHQYDISSISSDQSLSAILVESLIETNQAVKAINLLNRQCLVTDYKLLLPIVKKLWDKLFDIARESHSSAGDAVKLYFKVLVESGDWKSLSPALQLLDNIETPLPESVRKEGDRGFVDAIAYSETVWQTHGEAREQISDILQHRYRRKKDSWMPIVEKEIELHLMGAAIEQANRLTDAIDYYRWAVRLHGLRDPERNYFDERIAACLEKRIQWNIERQKPTEEDESKLNDLRKKLGDLYPDEKPNPSHYPGNGFLPSGSVALIKEREYPPTEEEKANKAALLASDPGKDETQWLKSLEAYAQVLASQEKWGTLLQEIGSSEALTKRFTKMTETQIDKGLTAILGTVIEPMALSGKITSIGGRSLQGLSDLIIPRLQRDLHNNDWNGCDVMKIDHDIAGAAIERLGRDVAAIQFYEWALGKSQSRRDRREMAKRLIVSRERYADYLESEKAGQQDRAIEQRNRAKALREDYQLLNEKLPLYPNIRE